LSFAAITPADAASSSTLPRERILLDAGWRFRLGDPADVTTNVTYYPEIADLKKLQLNQISGPGSETCLETNRVDIFATHAGENVSFVQPNFNDSGWQAVSLPHDWAVQLPFDSRADYDHGFKAIGDSVFGTNNIGWYRHTFTLPAVDASKKLWLEFDGVYRNCLLWLNGHILGRNVSGYSSFYFDATRYANPGGTNVLVVRVDASRFEGWFYEGAGIYRHVWLTTVNPVHVAEWGTFVYTSTLSGSNATVTIQTDVTNQSDAATSNGTLTSTIYGAAGKAVASVTSPVNISAGQQVTAKQTVSFAANLWSPKTPYLYKLVTTISNQNEVADIYNTPFGVRTVTIDPNNGVFINGQHVEILGMCNHQDHAGVGVALPDRLQYYRIERLLEMGANAYRTSHNEPTAELLDACDQLGMLVLDENRRIGTNAEPLSELTRQIRRDRNHPSVFMWSLGNEETGLQGNDTGAAVVKVMQNVVHSLDSTRLCTIAINNDWGKGFSKVIDVQGFNYRLNEMDKFHSTFPHQPCIGTETASQVGTRGIYTNDTSKCFVTAYDLHNDMAGWGEPAEQWWPHYHARPWSSGGFAWTGFDYRGEPTPYYKNFTNISSHFGTLDTCGFFKDNAFYYQATWTLKPVLHLFPHWNWEKPGQPIDVWVFGNCDAVELYVNGVSKGRKPLDPQKHVEWKVPFAPGTIRAVGYRFGEPVLTNIVETAGAPARIELAADRNVILADGRDVSVINVAVLDADGNVCPLATNQINFAVKGGTIIGVGNGNPCSHEADKASHRSVFNGLAQVIVQSTTKPGRITLTATSPGLRATELKLTAAKKLPPPAAPTGVSAVAGNGVVTVSWDIVPGATTYNIYRSTKRGGAYTLIAANISGVALGYVDHFVANDTTYYYAVSANGNGIGTSKKSVKVSATPKAGAF
jgi:beta-galactosidase